MSNAITVENLSKCYSLAGTAAPAYGTLRDTMAEAARRLIKREPASQAKPAEAFWALRDVSFNVNEGDVVGVVGRNGAGKSTLLKVLSRITAPTEGLARIRGRVGSLLEVGTGFHPELSGRENIFFNGAILGLRKHEIRARFDEIVDFAGIADFLDIPIKRYSSGMKMRLAFSVAAHLEPEIMIVDEVLAVGDAEFQKKCLGKMKDISSGGRTVLFVSHSMESVTSLCSRCILLDRGQVRKEGTPSEVILEYLGGDGEFSGCADFSSQGKMVGDDHVQLLYGEITDASGKAALEIDIRKPLTVRMGFRVKRRSDNRLVPNFHFVVPGGAYAFVSTPDVPATLAPGDYEASCNIPGDFLNDGSYFVGLAMTSYGQGQTVHFFEQSALTFNVRDPLEGSVGRHGYVNVMPGVVRPRLMWAIKEAR
ncbi:ABC transporter ATP-binding protein [Bosea sp. MMO-172]|uniref:ABC transporter ATP-binding protein n=1 Tax=Bosea sp. MMO-172 TaxID=3127885 RepID=UPI003018FD64